MTPVSAASGGWSAARARRRRAIFSLSRVGSQRRCMRWALAPAACAASRVARDRARRFRFDLGTDELRDSAHRQLVAGWVELFAPMVFERIISSRRAGRDRGPTTQASPTPTSCRYVRP